MAIAGRPAPGASRVFVSRKSFFAPCSLTKGIFIDSAIDFDGWLSFYDNAVAQFVTGTAQARFVYDRLNVVPACDDGPVFPQKQIGPRRGHCVLRVVIAGERGFERNAHRSIDGS